MIDMAGQGFEVTPDHLRVVAGEVLDAIDAAHQHMRFLGGAQDGLNGAPTPYDSGRALTDVEHGWQTALHAANRSDAAHKAVRFLLSEEGQRYFADQTAEYPANPTVKASKHNLPPVDSVHGPDIDLSKLSSLQQTLTLLQEVGLS